MESDVSVGRHAVGAFPVEMRVEMKHIRVPPERFSQWIFLRVFFGSVVEILSALLILAMSLCLKCCSGFIK